MGVCADLEEFCTRASERWEAEYRASVAAEASDLVVVSPGNGFRYLFDLAGSLRGGQCAHPPRVVAAWGRSRPVAAGRDATRMRGFPRPARRDDDRGHLISCAAGGGYDINLVPMDAAFNRGASPQGARFREFERIAAATPGTLFFVRLGYDDDTDRPGRFEVGVQSCGQLLVASFPNPRGSGDRPGASALRRAVAFAVAAESVSGCLDVSTPQDALFAKAWRHGPQTLNRAERCAVAGTTGHVAESVVEVLLDAVGWHVLWHFDGPGRHGADLLLLTPDDRVVVVEVKGTLVAGRVPRLSRRDVDQMSAAWLDKPDNPGMADLALGSADVYCGVAVVNFADLTWRFAIGPDLGRLRPVTARAELADLTWLGGTAGPSP